MFESDKKFNWFVAIGIVASLLFVASLYWSGLNGPFLLDDVQNIQADYVAGFNWPEIYYAVTHNNSGMLGRPVSVLSILFSGILHGPDSWGYKYHNLLIHLINGLLIFWILLEILPRLVINKDQKALCMVAGLSALLWMLHPIMVSTVLYAVQRMAELSALFTLVAILVYIFAREALEKQNKSYYFLAYLAFPLALLLAVFSKENGALVPFYIFVIELVVYRLHFSNKNVRNNLIVFHTLFVFIPIMLGSIYLATHFSELANFALRDYSMIERLMTQLHVMAFYLKLILLPNLSDMSLFHDDYQITRTFDIGTILLFLFFSASVWFVFYMKKRAPVISFFVAWFIVSHLMESTFLNLELVFEHRNYLAALGPIVILIYFVSISMQHKGLRYIPVFFIALTSFMTYARVGEWQSKDVFVTIAVTEHPESLRAQVEYAYLQFALGNRDAAIEHLEIGQRLNQREFGSVVNNIVYLCGTDFNSEELFVEAKLRAANYPVTPYALNSIDILSRLIKDNNCSGVTLDQLLELVQVSSNQTDTQKIKTLLGYLQRQEAQIRIFTGDVDAGLRYMISAYQNSGATSILVEITNVLLSVKAYENAEEIIGLLEELDQNSPKSEKYQIDILKTKLAELKP
ncbi:MAG: hypothetical protein COA71_10600 [SAR86 cluster bacterium]|uniref:Tetratricopeptide repeat protein n=1 Tax=SAR86 cluster bacterium TaxID=2030880 RepID=A0A2A5CA47_9GAMM|nr:MAG: hypothetical protein COA71_10600 [SAR86 cluster bacterium]